MSNLSTEATAYQTAAPDGLPWGIRFRYESAVATLSVVRASVAREIPGWEIREAFGQGGWFEAVPPPLPDYLADHPKYVEAFRGRLDRGLERTRESEGQWLVGANLTYVELAA